MSTRYLGFARAEAAGSSAVYERLALAVAADEATLDLLAALPAGKAQPNLLFGALRWHGAPVQDPAAALAWLLDHGDEVRATVLQRSTQTNEAARCAVLLPGLAELAARTDGPLAVVEVGASAGLCLLYDAWRYRYALPGGGEHLVGPAVSDVELPCAVDGLGAAQRLPAAVPAIAWRAGLDLSPLDPADADTRRWLECLVWPEHAERAERLRLALDVAARLRPPVLAGDMTTDLAPLLARARRHLDEVAGRGRGAVVVTHSAALVYLGAEGRSAVRQAIEEAGAHRLGVEGWAVLPDLAPQPPHEHDGGSPFLVSLDDAPLALAAPHGSALTFL
ncbi:DUF2332 domain-containing protein [Streptomyces sp. NP160]|uniref:DUF2332 domain-containing protein n=1 Tax=Streptomyces sp. NP160 TaxID=2586637 RepID=UPI00214C5326|nr:DUF2332 domain-containing protein [Streptomyces sp. NP160]